MTDNKAEAERLAPKVFAVMQKSLCDGLSDNEVDKSGAEIITTALDAAEQRGRDKGLEEALDVVAGLVFDGFGDIKTKIRARKGDKK